MNTVTGSRRTRGSRFKAAAHLRQVTRAVDASTGFSRSIKHHCHPFPRRITAKFDAKREDIAFKEFVFSRGVSRGPQVREVRRANQRSREAGAGLLSCTAPETASESNQREPGVSCHLCRVLNLGRSPGIR